MRPPREATGSADMRTPDAQKEGAVGLDAAAESGRAVEDGAAGGPGGCGAADGGCHVHAREDLEEEVVYGAGRRPRVKFAWFVPLISVIFSTQINISHLSQVIQQFFSLITNQHQLTAK